MKNLLAILASVLIVCACGSRNRNAPENIEPATETSPTKATSGWYYFSSLGIHAVSSPALIPAKPFIPWTEAVRVVDTALLPSGPVFLINKLGIMAPGSHDIPPALITDSTFFSDRTAQGFVLSPTNAAVHLYRNTFFTAKDSSAEDIFLINYHPITGKFSPLLRASDLNIPTNTQCTGINQIGSMWYGIFKVQKESTVEFLYREFKTFPPKQDVNGTCLLADTTSIDAAAYQLSVMPFPLNTLPDSILTLVSHIPAETPLAINLYPTDSGTTQAYVRGSGQEIRKGFAIASDTTTAVLFADGTMYIRDRQDTVRIFKLPQLSRGYEYSGFLLSGKKLLAAWEEQRFYETGRTGILEISLPDGVY
ncbi:MAG TPA: hypothetical protein GXZ47_01085 [Treponema sp.]|nr:hypothetical protein [Treponema sp.]